MPFWVLSLAYWLHILATVIWIGGMFTFSALVMPFVNHTLSLEQRLRFVSEIQRKFQPIGWFSLVVLSATGMFQMSEHPLYEGFLRIDNPWATALFIKHVLVLLMVIFMLVMTWGTLPALKRLVLAQSLGKAVDGKQQARLAQRERVMNRINLGLSVLVLLFTALARSIQ